MARGTLDALLVPVASALSSIGSFLELDSGATLLTRLGYKLPEGSDLPALFSDIVHAVSGLADALAAVVRAYEDGSYKQAAFLKQVADLVAAVVDVVKTADGLPERANAAIPDPDFLQHAGLDQLPTRLVDYLLVAYLVQRQARLESILALLGIVTTSAIEETDYNPPYDRIEVRWDRITKWFSDPSAVMAEEYGWRRNTFRAEVLLERIGALMWHCGIHGPLAADPDAVGPDAPTSGQLDLPLVGGVIDTEADGIVGVRGGLRVSRLDDPADPSNGGLAIEPYVDGSADFAFALSEGWSLALGADLGAQGLALTIQPAGANISVAGAASAALQIGLKRDGAMLGPLILFGNADATRLEIGQLELALLAQAKSDAAVDVGFELRMQDFKLVVAAAEGDGFLASVLPASPLNIGLDLTLGASLQRGFYVPGGAGLQTTFNVHQSIGPLSVDTIDLEMTFDVAGAKLLVDVTGGLKLGPVVAVVQGVGIQVLATFGKPGNLGRADIGVRFKPPNGIGLLVNASAVKGGGFLKIDEVKQQYSGVLQLDIQKTIGLKVIGLLDTKLPNGKPGFALLLIISVDFPPIQLGYGFTLNGVGGLAAFNRTMNVDALRDGIKNHTLDSIMFPPDPVANASKIISDLESVFPVAPGRFVFAPMVKIAWGNSVLLIEIGLAVELPSPLRLVIMGKVHLLLPPTGNDAQKKPDKAVEIHLDVLGILDLDRNEISVDAVLYDSRLAIFPITGGMALRIKWGTDPVFLLAIGGFNPRFAPPPGFPTLDRVGIQLAYDKNGLRAGLLLTSYVAVTSSTVQFGARIDAYAEVSIAKIAGYLGFDALVEMAPFHIIVDVYGGVTVRAFGIGFSCDLLLTLTAFDPVTGDGHLTIDFFGKHEVPIHFAIGDAKPLPALPVADPLAELVTALSDIRNWSAALPMGAGMLVTFRQLTVDEAKASAGQVLAHPMGELSVRQKVLPFDISIDRFGAAVPISRGPFAISEATFGAQTSVVSDKAAKLRDSFARGQFVTLSEDDKLTGPQFESFVNGYAGLGTDQVRLVAPQTVAFDYDVLVIDSVGEQTRRPLPSVTLSYGAMLRTTQFSASKAGSVDVGAPERFTGASKGISVVAPKYKVISVDQADPNDKTEFDTWTQADEKRRTGAKVSRRQVVESHEFA